MNQTNALPINLRAASSGGGAWCIWAVGGPQTYSIYAVKTAEDEIDKAAADAKVVINQAAEGYGNIETVEQVVDDSKA